MPAPTALELVQWIRLLDGEACNCDQGTHYAQVMVWKDGSGEGDDKATALFRSLLRRELGSFDVGEIGAAVLQEIDQVQA